ncbi:DnaA/Hda family protein [Phaeovulum sp. NW3]|uniref:DnaA ATPase domain-containing protein n=1 Tax=Phaeovulum sp. NW3 TaxID=2934933 RepID=UPI00201FB5E9|nr:DnaA/Hda family protein [Phaeovulum sp. NW3]
MERQLILDLPCRSAQGRDDFFVAPANALALATLDRPDTWPQRKMLLIGPEGAGKSHLAQIWADEHGAAVIAGRALTIAAAPALVAARAVVVEDAETIGGHPEAEAALFHLHNLAQAEGADLLISARTPPRDWGLALPDLKSRMQATASVRIEPPDEALLAAVLVKLFADRQLMVAPALIPWLVLRMDRSLATARRVVAALDARALAKGTAITRQLAAEVLDSLG